MEDLISINDNCPKTFAGQLFGGSSWVFSSMYKNIEVSSLPLVIVEESQIIEKISEVEELPISIDDDLAFTIPPVDSKNSGEMKIVWIGDSNLDEASRKTVDGMAKYLDLESNNYQYIPIIDGATEDKDYSDDDIKKGIEKLTDKLIDLNPLIVIVLGAKLTNVMLEKREKLTKIHGKIFTKKIKNGESEIVIRWVPCFHPELIQINRKIKESVILDLDSLKSTII